MTLAHETRPMRSAVVTDAAPDNTRRRRSRLVYESGAVGGSVRRLKPVGRILRRRILAAPPPPAARATRVERALSSTPWPAKPLATLRVYSVGHVCIVGG